MGSKNGEKKGKIFGFWSRFALWLGGETGVTGPNETPHLFAIDSECETRQTQEKTKKILFGDLELDLSIQGKRN